jgi:hypothetical protein
VKVGGKQSLLDPEDGDDFAPPKRRSTSNRIHGVITHKTVLLRLCSLVDGYRRFGGI